MGLSSNFTLPPLPSDAKDPERLIWMLNTIHATLNFLVQFDDPPVLDFHMRTRFRERWAEVSIAINEAIATLQKNHPQLIPMLAQAGMTGRMLELKHDSLAECVDGLYREVKTGSPILNLKWLKPTLKCMNTVLFSLIRAVPGVEMVKEYKDHFEVGLGIAEAKLAK